MLKKILCYLFSVKGLKSGAKLGGSALSGGAVVYLLITFVDAKDKSVRQYVDSKNEVVLAQVNGMKEVVKAQIEGVQIKIGNVQTQVSNSEYRILQAIKVLDSRVYNLANKKGI